MAYRIFLFLLGDGISEDGRLGIEGRHLSLRGPLDAMCVYWIDSVVLPPVLLNNYYKIVGSGNF